MISALNEKIFHFRGLSTDFAKESFPVPIEQIGNGSTFLTMDDGLLYIYDKKNAQWLLYTLSSGGGGGGEEPAAYLKNAIVDENKLILYKKNGSTVIYTPTDNNYTVEAKTKVDAIPTDPKYTDTIYDDSEVKAKLEAKQDKLSNGSATEVKNNSVNVLVDEDTLKINTSGNLSATKYTAGKYTNIENYNVSVDLGAIKTDLATVASTGDYKDLKNLPELSVVNANTGEAPAATLSVLKVNNIVYGIPTYSAGNGVIINSSNQISIDETKIATLDSVKTLLSEATQNLTINADSVTVKNSSGEQVAVATTNLLTTGTESSKVDIGNYVFTEIE